MNRASIKRFLVLLLAFVLAPAAAGAAAIAARIHALGEPLDAAPAADLVIPAPRPPETRLPLALVLMGNHGTEITDSLPIVELLAESGAFEVRVVAPERRPSPFATTGMSTAGVNFVPDLGFDDYATLVGRAPALIVVPYLVRWQTEDAAVLPWLRAHVSADTMLLSICQGAEVVAATGLFDGHDATANDGVLARLAARHPEIRWQREVRWVRDGNRMSSSLLAGGMNATLAAIDALAGRAAAERAVAATGYPGLDALEDRRQSPSRIPLGVVLEAAYRWERARVAIEIDDGVRESSLAGLVDAYAATYTTETIAVAAERRIVRSRSGLALVPRGSLTEIRGGEPVLVAAVEPTGEYGYDQAIRAVAATHGAAPARTAAELLNYRAARVMPSGGLPLGAGIALRPLAIGLAALLVALSAGARRPQRHVLRGRAGARRGSAPAQPS